MLFSQQNKKRIRMVWIVLGILVSVSMVLLYTPIF